MSFSLDHTKAAHEVFFRCNRSETYHPLLMLNIEKDFTSSRIT